MVGFKANVRMAWLTPALHRMLTVLMDVDAGHVVRTHLIVTSVNDSGHMLGSRHYTNEALDLRSHDLSEDEKTKLLETLRTTLGDHFTVLLEDKGGPNEHFHLQVRKGHKFH